MSELTILTPASAPETSSPEIPRSDTGQPVAMGPEQAAAFLESLQVMGNVSAACARAGVVRQAAYRARRRSPGFALAWDTALVAARHVAEAELADKAIHGWEEQVFYHGEEVARRRRFSDRLLLAHLGRMDRMGERLDVAASMPLLDDRIAALRAGGDIDAVFPAQVDAGALRHAQAERELLADPAGVAREEAEREAGRAAEEARLAGRAGRGGNSPQDCVTPVTPCPPAPAPASASTEAGAGEGERCDVCHGECRDPGTPGHREWTAKEEAAKAGHRARMEAQRPADAMLPELLATSADELRAIVAAQTYAYDCQVPDWWTFTDIDEVEEALGEPEEPEGGEDAGSWQSKPSQARAARIWQPGASCGFSAVHKG